MSTPTTERPLTSRMQVIFWRGLEPFLFAMAAIAVGRALVQQNLLDFQAYAYGHEQMPFAARYLMQPVLRWADSNAHWRQFAAAMGNSARSPMQLFVQAVNGVCLLLTAWLAGRIRAAVSPRMIFPWLTRWLFLWVVVAANVVRYEQRYSQAYDMVSMLVFTAGIFICIRRWPVPFLVLVLVGTYNRETTLFLIFVWLATTLPVASTTRARIQSLLIACLAGMEWLFVRRQILHWINRTSSGWSVNLMMNVRMLLPHHLPQVLSVGGYMALPLLLQRDRVQDKVLRRLWLGVVPFVGASVLFGWLNETRIFNEINALFAVTAAIVFELYAQQTYKEAAT